MTREHSIEEVFEDLEKLTAQVQRLGDRLDNAPFVRIDVHDEQVKNLTVKLADARSEFKEGLASVARLQMWMLGLLGTILVSAVVAVITAVAQGRL